ncbi:hypothetical protein [Mesorhizobium escarrei]|uniref:Transporter n=1 Tax=Mesorhizobium escarrei TaxID=666018 RepID=A0ABM9EB83_9HYPH|nr:hypothetical protein [Mesorhizobium escarrei]CAH2406081.1 conserved hypothetical protein [Mesorhizobium escarrei]
MSVTASFPRPWQPDTREYDFPFTYSKLITKDWSVFFTETLRVIDAANGDTRARFENLVIGTQYALYTNPEHQFTFTVGGTAALGGTGSSEIASSYSTLTPIIYMGKGLGDLPDSVAWLQPVNITANLGVALPTEKTTATGATIPDVLNWSFAVEYTMLKDNYTSAGHRYPTGWVPLVEVALTTPLDGPDAGFTTGTINPGVIWVGEQFQFGLEGIVPVNSRSGEGLGVRAQIHFYLGNIFPNNIMGKPIFD